MNSLSAKLGLILLACEIACTSASAATPFDPATADIVQLRQALDGHRISYEDLTRYYLQRLDRLDAAGPSLHAVIAVNPLALKQAQALDHVAHGQPHGLLLGMPFIAKDNFNSVDMPTTGGSAALRDVRPANNAFAVQRLLDQGAILIAKANMSELASSYGRLGYSSVGGLTLNPYDTARNASGSSSGSAAAIAAGYAAFALGTDTSGSVRGPANVTGLVGLRPTFGLIGRGGILPLSLSFDTPGILGRSVLDVAEVLDVVAAADPQDAATSAQPRRVDSYANVIDQGSLRGVRLGIVTNFRGGNDEVDAAERDALTRLKTLGATLITVRLPDGFEHLWTAVMRPVGEAEFKPQLERYLRALPAPAPRTLAELIQRSGSTANPALIEALRLDDESRLTDSPTYIDLLTQVMPSLRAQLSQRMGADRLDALVFSTMSCPASARYDRPDPRYLCRHDDPYRASYVASTTGFPEVTVPIARLAYGLPVGLSLLGSPFSEARLLSFARQLQTSVGNLPAPHW